MLKYNKLRIARPAKDLLATEQFYSCGLGFELLGKFEDHEGIDGIMLGKPGSPYHFEFTYHRHQPILPTPSKEDLFVFYVPNRSEWSCMLKNLSLQGYEPVQSLNPYWDRNGKTYEDPDGYRVVIQNADWVD